MSEKNKVKSGTLYVVGTPIGNLSDLSKRAKDTLSQVDFIAAEDTRVTAKLLNHLEIKKKLVSYFEHNKMQKGDYITDRILEGESCALVSDAGMPAISDPGELLVKQAREKGIEVYVVPGPSAVVSALSITGFKSGRFTFEGFLSTNKKRRKQHLEEIKDEKRTMIFYEAPHKLLSTLKDMQPYFSDRQISLVRELTKIHEECYITDLENAIKHYEENAPKGEFVLIIEGKETEESGKISDIEDAVLLAEEMIKKGSSLTEAAKEAANKSEFSKSEIYKKLI